MLRAAWAYRGFVLGSVRREFASRYRNALLGAAWSVLNPVAMILVYTVIFSQVMQARMPGQNATFSYGIYLCAGILSWGLFADITSRAQIMFIEQANLIKKCSFPRICVPLIVLINGLLNFGIIFGLFTLFLVATGNFPGPVFVALVPVLALLALFAIGLGLIVGVLNVFFRDVGQFFSIVVQFWFWLTPIVYTPEIVPAGLRQLLAWNPLAPVIGACQAILVRAEAPDWRSLVPALMLGVLMCMFGLRLFRRRSGDMVDEL
jgi:lipopolysaccharide transport system permease protein